MRAAVLLPALASLLAGCAGERNVSRKGPIDLSSVRPAPETYQDADFAHLQYILTPEQQAEYRSLPPERRSEWMRRVWAELDPTPTTLENERKEEHYRRLAYVRGHYAIDKEPGWDKRGELLLRYGVPDRLQRSMGEVVEGLGLVPPRELWVYARLGQAYRLEDPRFQGNFRDSYDLRSGKRASTPRDISASRSEADEARGIQSAFRTKDLDEIRDAEAALAQQRLEVMLTRGQEAYREKPQAYIHDYGGEELKFVFAVQNFASPRAGKTRVEVNTAFWAKDLAYRPQEGGYVALLGIDAVVKTLDYREVERTHRRTEDFRDSLEDIAGHLVLDQVLFQLDPGEYRLAISVRDSVSGNIGIYKTEMETRGFPPGELAVSDVQLALDVRSAQEGDPFVKGAYQVVPYPFGTFPQDRDVYLYFEIYGLELSPEGDCLYEIEFLIRPRTPQSGVWFGSSRGRVVPGVATSYEGVGKSSTVQEYIVLDPGTFTSDVYDVEISVRDRISERTAKVTIAFAVQTA